VVGFLFVLDIPIPKPSLKQILIMMAVVAFTVAMILAYTRFRLPDHTDRTNPIVEEIIEDIYETENP